MTYFASPSFVKTPKAQAGTGENLSGFAWSENIGWISFNSLDCDTDGDGFTDVGPCGGDDTTTIAHDYGVNVDTSTKVAGGFGVFSGFAWSENIGWLSFNQSDITGICPDDATGAGATVARVDWPTGKVSGWARAISGSTTSGWDGCIKLSKDLLDGGPDYGVAIDINTVNFSGHAWGSDVVGWIDFAPTVDGEIIPNSVRIGLPISSDAVTVTATVNGAPSASVVSGGLFTLRMNSANATSCMVVRSSVSDPLADDADASGASGLSVNYTGAWAGPTTVTWTYTCTGPGGTATDAATLQIGGPTVSGPAVNIYADPETITLGESSDIIWASSGATSCTVTDGSTTISTALSGSQSVFPPSTTIYSIDCDDGSVSVSDNVTVTVTAPTPSVTIYPIGQTAIAWTTENFTGIPSCSSKDAPVSTSWMTSDPTSGDYGTQSISQPMENTTYTIICKNGLEEANGSTTIIVAPLSCNNNGKCEPSNNENTVSCPKDCATIGGTGTR